MHSTKVFFFAQHTWNRPIILHTLLIDIKVVFLDFFKVTDTRVELFPFFANVYCVVNFHRLEKTFYLLKKKLGRGHLFSETGNCLGVRKNGSQTYMKRAFPSPSLKTLCW